MRDMYIFIYINIFVMFRVDVFYLNSAVRSLLSSLSVTMHAPVGGPVRTA